MRHRKEGGWRTLSVSFYITAGKDHLVCMLKPTIGHRSAAKTVPSPYLFPQV